MKAGFEVVGLPVVDASGHPLGTVRDLVLDDDGRQVLGISFARHRLGRRHRFLSLGEVQAFQPDRVVVAPDTPASAPPQADGSLAGKAVVSGAGRYLGTVGNIYFDERTGAIGAYEIVRDTGGRGWRHSIIVPATARSALADVMVIDHLA